MLRLLFVSIFFVNLYASKNELISIAQNLQPFIQKIHIERETQNRAYIRGDFSDSEIKQIKDYINKAIDNTPILSKLHLDGDLNIIKQIYKIEFITILDLYLKDNKEDNIENGVNNYLDLVDYTLMPLLDMQNNGINIKDYLLNFDDNVCIGASCGHFNELVIIANLNNKAKTIINKKEDLNLLQNILNNTQTSILSYNIFSDGKDNARTWAAIIIEDKNIDSNILDHFEKYRVSIALNNIYLTKYFIGELLSHYDKKYDLSNEINYDKICMYPKYLTNITIKKCENKIKHIFIDTNINTKNGIFINNRPCVLKYKNNVIKFGENQDSICKIIQNRINN